ncbi:DHH family phosphoesterase [Candidatus Saccharibacteria bacterium]|nr:DHH family phosphoesterase [Candidatus Saccharibacteria bacterium]
MGMMLGAKSVVVTAGWKYLDIDAYAGCIAYAELLRSVGVEARAVSDAPVNWSVPKLVKDLGFVMESGGVTSEDKFVMVDLSDPEMFEKFVELDRVVEVIDHHTGFEEFWAERIGEGAQIEFIGSVCTMIYEKYMEWGKVELLDERMCKLMSAAILDNTLNLRAGVTTERDRGAYRELLEIGGLDENWAAEYFRACEDGVLTDLAGAIRDDVKYPGVEGLPEEVGQVVVFDHEKVLARADELEGVFDGDSWMMNVISLKDGKSYVVAAEGLAVGISELLGGDVESEVLVLEKFMLRKEIVKRAQERVSNT